MDEVSVPPRSPWRSVVLNAVFGIAVVVAVAYIIWRGFAAESTRPPAPLFGQVSVLELDGNRSPFRLVAYADMAALKAGDTVIREKEPAAVVWRVASKDANHVRLERRSSGHQEAEEIRLPPGEGAARYILVTPAPAE